MATSVIEGKEDESSEAKVDRAGLQKGRPGFR